MVPICFSHKNASTDVQHDLLGSTHDLDLRSNSDTDLSRPHVTCFDAFRPEEHDAVKIMSLDSLVQKLFVRKLFAKKASH